jgi:hypothetical protein
LLLQDQFSRTALRGAGEWLCAAEIAVLDAESARALGDIYI